MEKSVCERVVRCLGFMKSVLNERWIGFEMLFRHEIVEGVEAHMVHW